jgi:CheY-like chemotaxis protein
MPIFYVKEDDQKQLEAGVVMATVVVMEDDEGVRGVVVQALELQSHRVIAFPDAAPALEKVDFNKVDLVVTDLEMPTDGEYLIRILRERGIEVPIIAMSGHIHKDDIADIARLISLGAQAVLLKPFTILSFIETIGKWV